MNTLGIETLTLEEQGTLSLKMTKKYDKSIQILEKYKRYSNNLISISERREISKALNIVEYVVNMVRK
jgi:hypothetical protein